jgi:hypothetical protein
MHNISMDVFGVALKLSSHLIELLFGCCSPIEREICDFNSVGSRAFSFLFLAGGRGGAKNTKMNFDAASAHIADEFERVGPHAANRIGR